ncbi:MAG: substrate-binding domain-containing protein [Sphingomonadales bacterium]|nr:substrate-binding domain-containing protein [Sphingomonadales bacterium]MDE2171499.1 substrate-binding domain-containing protein [Sphingomonadales bacterium]
MLALPLLAGCAGHQRPAPPSAIAPLHVLTSGGFNAAFDVLAAQYTKANGTPIIIGHGPSMGTTANAIPARLARGEDADVVILARSALDDLVAKGKVSADTPVDLALSKIAVAVKEGALAPDISSVAAVRQALLAARSIAWSDSASGVYIQTTMLDKLGVAQQVRAKGRMIPATPVGQIVAQGEAEIGFQQLSELLPVKGIRIVGLLPDSLQKVTAFSGGVVATSRHSAQARALLKFLTSSKAEKAIRASGMEPAPHKVKP